MWVQFVSKHRIQFFLKGWDPDQGHVFAKTPRSNIPLKSIFSEVQILIRSMPTFFFIKTNSLMFTKYFISQGDHDMFKRS